MSAMPDFPDISEVVTWPLILFILVICIARHWFKGYQFKGKENAKNKTIVVTGCSGGIGKQIVRELNYRGGKVIMACRSITKGQEAMAQLIRVGVNMERVILMQLDLSSFDSIRNFMNELRSKIDHIDILINNAGLMMYPKFTTTNDGEELQWQTNFLGPAYLTHLMLPLLRAAPGGEARIVNVTCLAHKVAKLDIQLHLIQNGVREKKYFDSRDSFSRSKLALVMFMNHLSTMLRTEGSNITCNCCHPGICYTNHFRYTPMYTSSILRTTLAPFCWFLLKTAKDGAQTPLYCALAKELQGVSGKYFSDCSEAGSADDAKNVVDCAAVYDYFVDTLGLSK